MEYQVEVGEHANRYYIKNFSKKYKKAWEVTLNSLIETVRRLDSFVMTDKVETIADVDGVRTFKIYFRVHNTKFSALTSGCRAIVVANTETKHAQIMLVYHKNDLGGGNETANWQELMKRLYDKK